MRARTTVAPVPRWRTPLAVLAWTAATLGALLLVRWGVEKWVWHGKPWLDTNGQSPRHESMAINLWTSVGALTGMVVGFLAGIRSRSLLGWVAGPTLGMSVAVLHYFTCTWLVAAGVTARHALLVPTSGTVVGWILGASQPTAVRATGVFVLLALADSAGRWLSDDLLNSLYYRGTYQPNHASWIVAVGPLAVATVLAAGLGARGAASAPVLPRQGYLGWRCVGVALLLLFAGLASAYWFQRGRLDPVGDDRFPNLRGEHPGEWMARDCAMLDRALLRHGICPKPQVSPSGRDFHDFLRAYDADRRIGYLICPRTGGPFHWFTIGETPNRAGNPVPVCILAEPWIHDASLVLFLHEDNPEEDPCPPFFSPDPLEAQHLGIGRMRFQQLARASQVERIAAEFAAAVVRRDAGLPTVHPRADPPHLARLLMEYRRFQEDLRAARKRQLASWTKKAELVRVEIDSDEWAHVMVVPSTPYPTLDDLPAESRVRRSPELGYGTESFWITDEGRIVGDEHETPPDGHPVVDWHIPIRRRWVELVEKGAPTLRIDLGPEAEAISNRRTSEESQREVDKR